MAVKKSSLQSFKEALKKSRVKWNQTHHDEIAPNKSFGSTTS